MKTVQDLLIQLNQNIISLSATIGGLKEAIEATKADVVDIQNHGCSLSKEVHGWMKRLETQKKRRDLKAVVAIIAAGGLIIKDTYQQLFDFIIRLVSTPK